MQLFRINLRPSFLAQLATLETRRGLEPKWDRDWGTRSTAVGHFFFLALVTVPEVFAKENSAQLWVTSFTFCYMRG